MAVTSGGEIAETADGKAEDRALKQVPAEVKADGKPERTGADAGEGEENSDGQCVEESPAQKALRIGISKVDGSEESGEKNHGPKGSEGFGELLEGIAAEGQLLQQGSEEQEHGYGGGVQQHVRREVEVEADRSKAGDERYVAGDEQTSEGKPDGELAAGT